MVEQAFLFDKKEIHLSVLMAAGHVFAGRPSNVFCLSWTLIPPVERNSANQQAHLRDDVSSKLKLYFDCGE